jgi:hypothetical protein
MAGLKQAGDQKWHAAGITIYLTNGRDLKKANTNPNYG